MVNVGLYIYINGIAKRVQLFNDEKISITSSIQDATDISKVRTDFSQSFTVPANENNNRIFSHWYNNSVDNGYDARKRKDAYIELDTIPFRKGKVQLEKASFKDGIVDNYTLTFYGSLVSLKDTFAGKKLFDLDFTAYNFNYNGAEVVSRVSGGVTNDVKFPLISSSRVWQTTGSTDNITSTGGGIVTTELFPALRLNKVFDAIGTNYGITFEGSFLTDQRFTNAFLYLKNAEKFVAKSSEITVDFRSKAFDPTSFNFDINDTISVDLTNDTFQYSGLVTLGDPDYYLTFFSASFKITCSTNGIASYLNIYKDGTLLNKVPFTSSTTETNVSAIFLDEYPSSGINNGVYKLTVSSENTYSFTSKVLFAYNIHNIPLNEDVVRADQYIIADLSQLISSELNISYYMPDIKVEDFFSGILKMFNLTCISYKENVYQIQQLEDWYADGSITDVTEHIMSDDINIDRLQSFKKINFKYEKSESFMNAAFLSNNGIAYGDLLADIDADGGEYLVSLPFEDMLFNKFTGQNLQVGYSLKQDFKYYQPKPMILYDYGTLQTCDFYLNYGVTTNHITTYNCFGQDTLIGSTNYSLNFGNEISSLLLNPIENSLYNVYYYNYLSNIYNYKTRKYSFKAIFPISLLTKLKLNDRVVIRDTRYLIDNMQIDLTSGEVNLTLINDFRTI